MKYIYTLLLSGVLSLSMAQNFNGLVLDNARKPLANVLIYSTDNHHSHSDISGKFQLKDVMAGDTIYLRYLGYKTVSTILQAEDFRSEKTFVLEEEFLELDQISVSDALNSTNIVAVIDLKTDPVNSSQEILRRIPGLIIGQHAGGGKAEQIFLRGFDIDHGTDIAINVDGMPVNMVSHAHGQGYSDLHFLIPETVDNIDFGKGPYYTDMGNFNTAGYANFRTKNKLDYSSIGLEIGQFNTFRTVGMFDLMERKDNQDAYIAAEYILSDGPFESPQSFNRINLMGKFTTSLESGNELSLTASHFQSKWDASGQIPQRLVDDGTITRFGAVDDTEGGNTSRTNFNVEHTKVISKNSFLKTNAYYSHYDFQLFSNFTFFLEDPVNGDQIMQREDRNIFGFSSKMFQTYAAGETDIELSYGIGLRYDDSNDNELSRTLNRKNTLENISLGNIDETNISGFVNAKFDFGDWSINPGVRLDYFSFDYVNNLSTLYDNRSVDKVMASPKLNILYNPSPYVQFYLKSGVGFHSNDTRVVTAQDGKEILPAAYGADLGTVWKPLPKLWLNVAAWYLFLEQEFVYVGDAGIVEPSGKTQRSGVDVGLRYQLGKNLFFNSDLTYTHARAVDEPEGADYIPLAVELMATGGLTIRNLGGFSGGIHYRYVADRPANEDNSINAPGYFITDINLNYTFERVTLGINIENLFDQEWNETQFATESRLRDEPTSVEEIHFTPGTPFFFSGSLKYRF